MNMDVKLKFDEKGLLPAVVQDNATGQVLMVAYMNEQSIEKTLETETTWFYSRSRKRLWNKGETSGNIQKVVSIDYDCDADTLLVKVDPAGPACHTGNTSCFYRRLYESETTEVQEDILDRLERVIKERKEGDDENSYTRYLFNKGIDKILKKVGEESAEVIIAAKNEGTEELVYEAADLIYHLMVLLEQKETNINAVKRELAGRFK
ncbi:MAG: bifunctional phosphoribosyl-AMP cyclohydrolase/phosphoribosyl-ATP diphosphatase HisIE [Peptostreptococcaceae bacterium]|nr:bifunctional phosphoribosyl-AMP cyclohydrolase/phosphoribosyl-ATP diphosphatase HisIE [Peptostreptococcaceae bacterium]